MGPTRIGVADPRALKRWSSALAVDTLTSSYFSRKFMSSGTTPNTPIQLLTNLESDAGDQISFDLSMQLQSVPIKGDNRLEGSEEALVMYTDRILIDQARGAVSGGGRMSRKRTLHDLRSIAKDRMSEWWARYFDELFFIYLSGARGINPYIESVGFTGFAGNPIQAPDANHLQYAGQATASNNMLQTDIMDITTVNRLKARADTVGGGDGVARIQPVMIDGEEHYVLVMHPWQEYDLRSSVSAGQWVDLQKALSLAEGNKNAIFKGGLGMINNVILHSHKSVTRFNTYGVGGNVNAARALFMGAQAATCAFGMAGTGIRFGWVEYLKDAENELVISSNSIFGIKKTRFNNQDFGVIAVDTATNQPY